jgi:CRP/FNR family transcriptional regulator, cyclic AMP receptor protein
MHLAAKQSDLLSEFAVKIKELTQVVCNSVVPLDGDLLIASSGADIFAGLPQTQLLLILEGSVDYQVGNKLVMHFEAGDLLGLQRSLNLPQGKFSCTSPTRVCVYDRNTLVEHANKDLSAQRNWTHLLACNLSFYEQALAQELRGDFQPTAGFIQVNAGDVIIHQGDHADQVYTLLEGSAEAVCDNVKVGEINANEIFGALAVFTRQPRMASVIATSDCTLLAVRKEEFIDLIECQPQICLGLIEEMAAKINQLNNQVTYLKNSS